MHRKLNRSWVVWTCLKHLCDSSLSRLLWYNHSQFMNRLEEKKHLLYEFKRRRMMLYDATWCCMMSYNVVWCRMMLYDYDVYDYIYMWFCVWLILTPKLALHLGTEDTSSRSSSDSLATSRLLVKSSLQTFPMAWQQRPRSPQLVGSSTPSSAEFATCGSCIRCQPTHLESFALVCSVRRQPTTSTDS